MTKPQILPTLDQSLAEFSKVEQKHRELCNRRDEIRSELAQAEMPGTTIGSAAVALLDDMPVDVAPTIDRESLTREAAIVDQALALNTDRLRSAQAAHAERLYADRRDEHLALVENVLSSFEALADAIQAERGFRESFNRWSTSIAPALRTTETPWLRFFLQPATRGVLRQANRDRFNLPATKKGKS